MRLKWLNEGCWLLFTLVFFGFFLFDEEPIFDVSDWNALHSVLLLFSAMIVIWENVSRARYGQFVHKDQTLLFATFSFWFFIENYLRIIVVLFCVHSLCPLEAELIEMVEVYQTLTRWVSVSILPVTLMLSVTLFLGYLTNLTVAWGRKILLVLMCFIVCLSLTMNIFFIAWDILFNGLTSLNWFAENSELYLQPKTSLTQNHYFNVQDQYDWHREKTYPFVMRFEDLLLFFIQIFNLCTLFFCLIVWLSLIIDLVLIKDNGVSYTYIGVALRWLEHASWNLIISHTLPFVVGLRISLRTPFEFWFIC